MKPIIEVKGISKKYQIGEQQPYITLRDSMAEFFKNPLGKISDKLKKDEFWALKDINFTVEPGEVIGIIGRNGAGKSTLLKIMSRITPPTTGEIVLRGRVGSLLEVGTGFQQELTGRENIYLNGAILGMKQTEIKLKFDEIVDFSEVEKFIDTPVKHYSSGMYMRLAFSIAAHLDPEILIVDEVLAVGDSNFQKKCLGKMDDISKKEGKAVLFVSHNLVAVNTLCDKGLLLNKGTLIKYGDINQIVERYESLSEEVSVLNSSIVGELKNDIVIESVLINSNKSYVYTAKPLQDIKFDFFGKVKCNFNKIRFNISISNSSGRIFTISDKLSFQKIKRGKYHFSLRIPKLCLRPGQYMLSFGGLSSENGNKQFLCENIRRIFVSEEWSDINLKENFGSIIIDDYESNLKNV